MYSCLCPLLTSIAKSSHHEKGQSFSFHRFYKCYSGKPQTMFLSLLFRTILQLHRALSCYFCSQLKCKYTPICSWAYFWRDFQHSTVMFTILSTTKLPLSHVLNASSQKVNDPYRHTYFKEDSEWFCCKLIPSWVPKALK